MPELVFSKNIPLYPVPKIKTVSVVINKKLNDLGIKKTATAGSIIGLLSSIVAFTTQLVLCTFKPIDALISLATQIATFVGFGYLAGDSCEVMLTLKENIRKKIFHKGGTNYTTGTLIGAALGVVFAGIALSALNGVGILPLVIAGIGIVNTFASMASTIGLAFDYLFTGRSPLQFFKDMYKKEDHSLLQANNYEKSYTKKGVALACVIGIVVATLISLSVICPPFGIAVLGASPLATGICTFASIVSTVGFLSSTIGSLRDRWENKKPTHKEDLSLTYFKSSIGKKADSSINHASSVFPFFSTRLSIKTDLKPQLI